MVKSPVARLRVRLGVRSGVQQGRRSVDRLVGRLAARLGRRLSNRRGNRLGNRLGDHVALSRWGAPRGLNQWGVTTAEYAVVTAAGCGFAAVLIKLLTSAWGQQLLKTLFDLVLKAVGL